MFTFGATFSIVVVSTQFAIPLIPASSPCNPLDSAVDVYRC